ncbi:hypothetical protein OOK41_15495 [Micromonospora sp. NBC_01655]|uniref:hypothetical protein n=1 Tax=Micromonospora sp. NBC_01655 TaxID=2975983 RepID=UPI0022547156|nr:hypothetical protein [Micromonospora sp. NBC_01655]MCX4471690.1 hypothetical protein [Micromonospora sp. NBC_01655]
MSVQIVRFSTGAEEIGEVEDGIKRLFAAVEEAAPTGIDYTALRVGDGAEFLLILELADADTNPLLEIQEALAFRAKVAGWAEAPVPPQSVTVLGRYSR